MPTPDLLPGPPEPREEMIPATVNLDKTNLDWLDDVADRSGRSRSDALREILRNVREQQARRSA
jgi:metal-responsive CopG/Arc/MetJ family transcriptional regulator